MDCVQNTFPNVAILKKIKRLKFARDRNRMKKIKQAIFKGVGIEQICEEFGINMVRDTKDVKTIPIYPILTSDATTLTKPSIIR